MNNNKVKFDLVEQISEHRVKLKGIIGGDRFEVDKPNKYLYVYSKEKLTALITYKSIENSSGIIENEEVETYNVYI